MSQREFHHVVSASTLCFDTLGPAVTEARQRSQRPSVLCQRGGSRTTASRDDEPAGGDFEAGTWEDEGLTVYLDSGYNTTCHGSKWLKKYTEKSGYDPMWESHVNKVLTGIGGASALGSSLRLRKGTRYLESWCRWRSQDQRRQCYYRFRHNKVWDR